MTGEDARFYSRSRVDESHGVEGDFSDESVVGNHHGDGTEENFEIVRKFGSTSVSGVHGDEHGAGGIERKFRSFEHEPEKQDGGAGA